MTTYDVLEYIPSVIRPTLMMDMSSSTLLQHVIAALVGSFVPWIVMYGSVLSLVLVFADQLKPHKLDARPVDMKFLMTEVSEGGGNRTWLISRRTAHHPPIFP